MANRSSFPNQIDTFIEHVDISPSDIANVQRYQELKLKENKTSAEIEELNNLTTLLRDKILTPEDFNKLQDAMVNIETFTKDTLTNYYKYMGNYNSTTAYKTFNSVMYNGDIYLALYDVQGVLPTDTSKWLKISQKGDKGDKAFNWKGVYNNNTAYIVDDVVYYNGSSYVCIRSSTGNLPTDVAYWNPVSLKGSDGIGYKFKGAWNSSYAYNLDDAVSYDNKIYYCIQTNVGQVPTNADYWLEFLTQETQANQISITDVNGYYVSTNVEDALKEVWEANLSGTYGTNIINLMPDSGRFMGETQDSLALYSSNPFAASSFFIPYNGSSAFTSAGKFIHNNTTYGGTRGNLTQDVIDLLYAMGAKAGRPSYRYGVEFYIAQTTMGSGTNYLYNGKYLLTTNNNRSLGGVYTTWAFWIRIKSGGSIYILKSNRLYRDLVEVTTTHTEITPADGWVHIVVVRASKEGYNSSIPYIYANNGDVVQIALPVVTPGGIGIGWHTAPIPTVSAVSRSEYTDANVLAKIKNVDGAGSGLDADKLQGKVPSDFMSATKVYGSVTYTDSIVTNSTLTKTIALGGSYKHGIAVVSENINNIFHSGLVFFGSNNLKTKAVGYVFGDAGIAACREFLGSVTSTNFGFYWTGHNKIRINELYISGTNLVIVFNNLDTKYSNSLNCRIDWEVW